MSRKIYEISFAIAGKMASSFGGAFSGASSYFQRLRSEMQRLNAEYKHGGMALDEYSAKQRRLTQQIQQAEAAQKQLNQSMKMQGSIAKAAFSSVRNALTVGGGAVVVGGGLLLTSAVKDAIEFEDAMGGIAKQADGARDANGKLTDVFFAMRKETQQLGREIPVATNKLAEMQAAGLRMGVARTEVAQFTREVAKMSTAFDADDKADEIAEKMGKLANVMQIPIMKISDLADTINYLDDNSVAKGLDIINVMQRVGGVLKQANMDAHQGAALASTFLSLGKSEEVAATATNALIRELLIAKQQPPRFQEAIKKLGMTSEQVNKGMVKDAQGTILKILDAINALEKSSQAEITTGLFGKEYGDDVAAIAGAVGEYRRQIGLLNDEKRKGSMNREFEARLKGSSAQLQLLENSVKEVKVAIGTMLLPALNIIFGDLAKFSQKSSETLEKYSAKVANTVRQGVDEAKSYLKSHFLNNPEFTKLPTLQAKIGFIVDDIMKQFQSWLDSGGQQYLTDISTRGVNIIATGIENAAPRIAEAAILIGKTLGTTLLQTMEKSIKEHPISAFVFGAAKGSTGLETGGVQGVPGQFIGAAKAAKEYYFSNPEKFPEWVHSTFPTREDLKAKINSKRAQRHGTGGIFSQPHLGIVAEAGVDEAIIPLDGSPRSKSLWQTAGERIGASSGGTVINAPFAPVIHGAGAEILPALQEQQRSFIDQLKDAVHQQRRVSFGDG